jgi:uroporphyrinogen-III synthase
MGLDAIGLPLFIVHPLPWVAPDPAQFDALLLTSANAIRHGGEQLELYRHLPVKAVGEATANAARAAGFGDVLAGPGRVQKLLDSLPSALRLLHLGGRERTPVESSQPITAITIYAADPIPVAEDSAALLPGSIAALHSSRAARRLREVTGEAGLDRSTITLAAISSVAAEAAGDGWEWVESAEWPDDDALLALARRLCDGPHP